MAKSAPSTALPRNLVKKLKNEVISQKYIDLLNSMSINKYTLKSLESLELLEWVKEAKHESKALMALSPASHDHSAASITHDPLGASMSIRAKKTPKKQAQQKALEEPKKENVDCNSAKVELKISETQIALKPDQLLTAIKRLEGAIAPQYKQISKKAMEELLMAPLVPKISLYAAAAIGDLEKLKECLNEEDVDKEFIGKEDLTPLMAAARNGHESCVIELIRACVDINAKHHTNSTALMLASYAKSTGCVEALIDAGATVNEQDIDGNTSLHFAQSPQVALALMIGGADPYIENYTGDNVFNYCDSQEIIDTIDEYLGVTWEETENNLNSGGGAHESSVDNEVQLAAESSPSDSEFPEN